MKYQLNKTNYHDFSVFQENRLPARSYFIPYLTRGEADAVPPKKKRYRSCKVQCLNGMWDFKFYPRPIELPDTFDTDAVSFDTIDVPSCWQTVLRKYQISVSVSPACYPDRGKSRKGFLLGGI